MAALDRAFQQGLAFVGWFLFSGLTLIFTLAAIESFTPYHVPLGPGRTILAWAIGCAAFAMGLHAAGRVRRRMAATADAALGNGAEPGLGPVPQQIASGRKRRIDAEQLRSQAEMEIAEALRAQEDRAKDIAMAASAIDAARWRPILFREIFPPPAEPGLSFYGGVPIGRPAMSWPREEDGTPLAFVMQWECAALARLEATGLFPKSGALYLFVHWVGNWRFRFFHQPGDAADWRPLTVPADLPPAFGKDAAYYSPMVSARIPAELRDAPQLLPCWPFVPVAIDCARVELGEEGQLYWGDTPVAELQVRVQNMTGALVPKPETRRLAGRPFVGFPHDWAAVRIVATEALESLDRVADYQWRALAPDADSPTREALVEGWRAEARALYEEATHHPAGQAVPRDAADQFWQRIEPLVPIITLWDKTVRTSINISLGLGSDGLPVVPADEIEACAGWHSLGSTYEHQEYEHEFRARLGLDGPIRAATVKALSSKEPADRAVADALSKEAIDQFNLAKEAGKLEQRRVVHAPTPNRMFGAPSCVQGYVEEYLGEWLLLLELVSNDSIGFGIGEGVIQFLIRPRDLAAGRFDQVEVIQTGY